MHATMLLAYKITKKTQKMNSVFISISVIISSFPFENHITILLNITTNVLCTKIHLSLTK